MAAARYGHEAGRPAGRGRLFFRSVDFIRERRPHAFVLENSERLRSHAGGSFLTGVISDLKGARYHVTHGVLNTLHHGLPQFRARMYIVGIRRDVSDVPVVHPEAIP